jgi:hypothetical protein
MAVFALTIFTGAFLLFQVQPLIAKYILPWFGGTPSVWTTCMLFFQVVLLAGYAYAHLTTKWLKPRAQALVHLVLLVAALALLPIIPSESWKPISSDNPTGRILALLAVSLGLPYFALSATGPLMQQWFSRTNPGRSPYRLYALSNVGSLLALVSYPFFFENHFDRKTQAYTWGWGLAGFVVLCTLCALKLFSSGPRNPESKAGNADNPGAVPTTPLLPIAAPHASTHHAPRTTLHRLLWLLLPACASLLLLAVTNKMCEEIAVVPFLWVLPLAVYLLSFIICFDSPRWYVRFPFAVAFIGALTGLFWAVTRGNELALPVLFSLYSTSLFVCCMVCHGELYRLKPSPEHLTSFYLMIALGGALGGILVALVAPLVFTDYYELDWGILLCGLLYILARRETPTIQESSTAKRGSPVSAREWRWLAALLPLVVLPGWDYVLRAMMERANPMQTGPTPVASWLVALRVIIGVLFALAIYVGLEGRGLERSPDSASAWLVRVLAPWTAMKQFKGFTAWRQQSSAWMTLGLLALAGGLWAPQHRVAHLLAMQSRNFYGVLKVFEDLKNDPNFHYYSLQHGQTLHGLQFTHPIGATFPTVYYYEQSGAGLAIKALPHAPRHIGLVGVGVGTLCAYAGTNDSFRLYEINPEVLRLAKSRFTYISGCHGKVETALGDARLSLEREPSQQFDLLALDAFSGDAVPVHLLTKEAFQVYARHVKDQGVIAVHVTNRYLDLEPVLANLARELNYNIATVEANPTPGQWWNVPSLWVLLTHDKDFLNAPTIRPAVRPPHTRNIPLWTDNFSSLFQVLR